MDTRLARVVVRSSGRKSMMVATLLLLLCSSAGTALANYQAWFGYGYWLEGQTNWPISFDNVGTEYILSGCQFL